MAPNRVAFFEGVRVKGMLSMLFQRLYAMNLRRTWRNSPGAAWADAISTLDVLLAFPILSLLGGAWLVATDIFPRTVGRFGTSRGSPACGWFPVIIVIAPPYYPMASSFSRRSGGEDCGSVTRLPNAFGNYLPSYAIPLLPMAPDICDTPIT